MCHDPRIESIDRILEESMEKTILINGKVLLIAKHIRQILLVIPSGSKTKTFSAGIESSSLYHGF